MKFQVNQMALFTAIMSEIDRQAKERRVEKLQCSCRQLNAMVKGANLVVAAMNQEDVPATPGMGVLAWMLSDDTGLSSKCMCRMLFGIDDGEDHHPLDASDFGRCYRFLQAAIELPPDWRSLMSEVSPSWKSLMEHWDHLTDLWESKEYDFLSREIAAFTKNKPL